MRLLILDQFSDPGGAQQGLLEFLPAMRQRGWSAIVGLPGDGELFGRVRDLGFQAERISCGPYRSGSKSMMDAARFAAGSPVLATQIRRLAHEAGAQLVYVNGPRLLPAVALSRLSIPLVFHSHSYLFPGVVRRCAGAALRSCDTWLIGSCRFVAEQWQPYVRSGRQTVIYNGVAGPAAPRPPAARSPIVGCVGRIAPEKGQREFVAAASLIRRSLPGCRFVIYGAALFDDPGVQQYDAEVRSAGAAAGVEFRGWVKDIYPALEGMDLLLVPSAGHEATTRTILEAHAAGVPVIAFRSGGIPEVVEHGQDGWLADSVEDMAQLAIEVLGRDSQTLAEASRRSRATWTRKFTLQRFHEQLSESLERAAQR